MSRASSVQVRTSLRRRRPHVACDFASPSLDTHVDNALRAIRAQTTHLSLFTGSSQRPLVPLLSTVPTNGNQSRSEEMNPTTRRTGLLALAVMFSAGIHAALVPEHLKEMPPLGYSFIAAALIGLGVPLAYPRRIRSRTLT